MRYRVYGVLLESDEPLPGVAALSEGESGGAGADADADIVVSGELGMPAGEDAVLVPAPEAASASDWPAIWRSAAGYRLEFGELFTYFVERSGWAIRRVRGAGSSETQVHLLLDHVVPRALCLLGLHPLHATAVAAPGGALIFLGSTGTGKSTLAAALGALGCRLVTDDCLVLEHQEAEAQEVLAVPGYAGLRLYADSRAAVCPEALTSELAEYTHKRRVSSFVEVAQGRVPVRACYALSRSEGAAGELAIDALGPADAVMTLMANAFRMDLEEREPLKQQLRFLSRVASRVPIKRCELPSDLAKLPEVAKRVLEDAFGG